MNILLYQGADQTLEARNIKFIESILKIDKKILVGNRDCDEGSVTRLKNINTQREFSSYEVGLNYIKHNFGKNINLVVANETIFNHRVFDRPLQKAFKKSFSRCHKINKPAIAGVLDKLNNKEDYFKLGYHQESFISTWLFMLNKEAVSKFDTFLIEDKYVPDKNNIGNHIFKNSYSSDYLLDIEKWVTLQGNHKKWYGNEPLNDKNRNKLTLKAISIINERWVSYQLQIQKVQFFNVQDFVKRGFIEFFLYRFFLTRNSIMFRLKRLYKGLDIW
jgi:hypothetical protein